MLATAVQATVCAKFGLPCIIYMGSKDMERQALNVFRMRLLGAEVRLPLLPGPGIRIVKLMSAYTCCLIQWEWKVPPALLDHALICCLRQMSRRALDPPSSCKLYCCRALAAHTQGMTGCCRHQHVAPAVV